MTDCWCALSLPPSPAHFPSLSKKNCFTLIVSTEIKQTDVSHGDWFHPKTKNHCQGTQTIKSDSHWRCLCYQQQVSTISYTTHGKCTRHEAPRCCFSGGGRKCGVKKSHFDETSSNTCVQTESDHQRRSSIIVMSCLNSLMQWCNLCSPTLKQQHRYSPYNIIMELVWLPAISKFIGFLLKAPEGICLHQLLSPAPFVFHCSTEGRGRDPA